MKTRGGSSRRISAGSYLASFASLLFCLVLFLPESGLATLGEIESSIDADTVSLKGTRVLQPFSGYTVHNIVAGNGNQIKEYITPQGRVFALTWNGISHPDLSSLLGSYFKEYESKRTQTGLPHGRKLRAIQTARVVVMKSGHMRNVRGGAFVPDLVPPGVKPEELN